MNIHSQWNEMRDLKGKINVSLMAVCASLARSPLSPSVAERNRAVNYMQSLASHMGHLRAHWL